MSPAPERHERSFLGWYERVVRRHWVFLLALVGGTILRYAVLLAFRPALIVSDSSAYLSFLGTHQPSAQRPLGVAILEFWPLAQISTNLVLIAISQHLMGLVMAATLYALMLRWGVKPWLAALATLPVLFDSMQVLVEQMVYSDPLFELLLILSLVVLMWRRRPTTTAALVAGVLLGTSVTVRVVGEPLVVLGVAFCLIVGLNWRTRLVTAVAFAVAFALPVGLYMSWYHQVNGPYALTQFGGTSLYMRSTTFVDCSKVKVPQYLKQVCPTAPVGHRADETDYGWHNPFALQLLDPPPGVTNNEALQKFGIAAIKAQPFDYVKTVAREFVLNFDITRGDRLEHNRSFKWKFSAYVDTPPNKQETGAYAQYGGEQPVVSARLAHALVDYQKGGYLPGPLLAACMLLGLAGSFGFGKARRSRVWAVCALPVLTGIALMLIPVATEEFIWRYQMPSVAILPVGAALAWTAIRGHAHYPDEGDQAGPEPTTASRDGSESADSAGRKSRFSMKNRSTNTSA